MQDADYEREHKPPRKGLNDALGCMYLGTRRIGRHGFGGHVFDPNGVCIYCSRCLDRSCCDLKDKCPHDEPYPEHSDGSGSHAPDTCATSEDGAL